MEKLVYLVWKERTESRDAFCGRLLDELAPALLKEKAVAHLQLNVADAAIEAGEATMLQSNTLPPPRGMVSVWVDSAATQLEAVTKPVAKAVARTAAYLVTESVPIVNTTHTAELGKRTPGFSQIAVLRRPPRLTKEDWLAVWQGSHIPLAIDTQDTFLYVHNVVARTLTYAAPHYDAIVEECFPEDALTNPEAFYDARGDAKKLEKHMKLMMDSCVRFIDFDKIDVILTSQYCFK